MTLTKVGERMRSLHDEAVQLVTELDAASQASVDCRAVAMRLQRWCEEHGMPGEVRLEACEPEAPTEEPEA